MKRNARTAYDKLKALGVPMYIHDGETYHFLISAEENYDTVWADYYAMTDGVLYYDDLDDFGVNEKINEILDQHGLFCEWQNPGALGVYDAW
jgi:hypothetical protein